MTQPSRGKKGLKWKKDGTAKCGYYVASVQRQAWLRWRWTITHEFVLTASYCRTSFGAKKCAETWLRKQANQMLKDLGGPK